MIDVTFDDKILTKNVTLWQKKNKAPSGNYADPPLLQFILDVKGLNKIIPFVDGFMLKPVWTNDTFKIEAKTQVFKKFEEVEVAFKQLRDEGQMIFLMSFYFCPDFPLHSALDPNTFEPKVLDKVIMTNNAHWKIRYGLLEPIQPPERKETLEEKIERLKEEGVIQ